MTDPRHEYFRSLLIAVVVHVHIWQLFTAFFLPYKCRAFYVFVILSYTLYFYFLKVPCYNFALHFRELIFSLFSLSRAGAYIDVRGKESSVMQ